MPVVTPFGELTLKDDIALDRWLQAHAIRHQLYVSERVDPKGGILDGPVDGDWMLRHAFRHVTIATYVSYPLPSADTKVLAMSHRWKTEAELQDWHALHNRLHSLIDKVHGVTARVRRVDRPQPIRPP